MRPKGTKKELEARRKPQITEDQYPKLEKLLLQGAKAHGYHNDLWTLERIAKVIEKHFGISLSISSVWRKGKQ